MPKSAGKKQIYLPKTDRLYITMAEARKITDQQIREHIASPKPECACEECQEMCRIRPCWGTPKQIRNILIQYPEYARKMAEDFYAESLGEDIPIVAGSVPGAEGGRYPFWPTGACGLYVGGKCLVHHMKPIEGVLAHCENTQDEYHIQSRLHHRDIPKVWNTKKGRKVVKMWRSLYSRYSPPISSE